MALTTTITYTFPQPVNFVTASSLQLTPRMAASATVRYFWCFGDARRVLEIIHVRFFSKLSARCES